MNALMERPELKEALKTPREQREFFEHVQKYGTSGDRGLTERELKPMLEELKNNHTDHITDKDAYTISHALLNRRSGRYIPPTPLSAPVTPPKKTGWF